MMFAKPCYAQVVLLVNIAFSVPYRVAFNSDPDVGSVSRRLDAIIIAHMDVRLRPRLGLKA